MRAGQEDERQVARVESGQREERRDENRESGLHHILPLCPRVDAVRGRRFNRGVWKSVIGGSFSEIILVPKEPLPRR